MKKTLFLLAAAAALSLSADVTEPKVVWSGKFEKEGSPADNGFKRYRDNGKDQFTVRDGVLTMVCQNSPYKGSGYEKAIPGIPRGELTFEAFTGSGTGYNHYSLSMGMGRLLFSWRGKNAWHLYHPKENRWHTLSDQVSNKVWHKYKISFDTIHHTAEFYVDDMENPVFIDEKSEFVPGKNVKIRISNYGLCNGTIINKLRNIELKAVPPRKKIAGGPLKGTMVFRGISDTFWPLRKLVADLGEKEVAEFILQIPPHHVKNDNVHFDLQPKPSPSRGPAKYIILADMPSTPIPLYTMKMIRTAVENGGKLIILDGMFTLQKGEYAGTVLEEILPVSVRDKWGKAKPLPGVDVFKYNGRDAVISKTVGKGKVCVVLGNAIQDPSVTDVLNHYSFK